MHVADFDFHLPDELVAQFPPEVRGGSRLLHVEAGGALHDRWFRDLPTLLRADDLLVMNDTRVIKARLFGHKDSGGKVELLVERVTFLVDGREGLAVGDEQIAQAIRAVNCPVLLVVNKADDKRARARVNEFHALGLGDILEISSEHGTGVFELLDALVAALPAKSTDRSPTSSLTLNAGDRGPSECGEVVARQSPAAGRARDGERPARHDARFGRRGTSVAETPPASGRHRRDAPARQGGDRRTGRVDQCHPCQTRDGAGRRGGAGD